MIRFYYYKMINRNLFIYIEINNKKYEKEKTMDKKEKNEKKRIISEHIDLGNGRYKDDEVNILHELATNREKYNGHTKTIKDKYVGWSSDGKYTREKETTYTFIGDDEGVRIEEKYQSHDDDGQRDASDRVHNNGREILNLYKSHFND